MSFSSSPSDHGNQEPKLFGFSLNPLTNHNTSIISANTMVIKKRKKVIMIKPLSPSPPQSRFKCEYCNQMFRNSQALGGHQNAHKAERKLAKLKEVQDLQLRKYIALSRNLNISHAHFDRHSIVKGNYVDQARVSVNYEELHGGQGLDLEFRLAPSKPRN